MARNYSLLGGILDHGISILETGGEINFRDLLQQVLQSSDLSWQEGAAQSGVLRPGGRGSNPMLHPEFNWAKIRQYVDDILEGRFPEFKDYLPRPSQAVVQKPPKKTTKKKKAD